MYNSTFTQNAYHCTYSLAILAFHWPTPETRVRDGFVSTETHVTVLGHSNHSVTEKGIITIDLRGNSHFFQKCVYLHVTVRGM